MINRKIVLSLLTIFFIGAAAAGTWANIAVTAAPTPTVTATAMEAPEIHLSDGTTGYLYPLTISNIVPGESGDSEIITIYNGGPVGSKATLTATVDTTGSDPELSRWMKLWIPSGTYFYNQGSVGTINLGTIGGGGVLQLPMKYTFVDSGISGSQNDAAGKSFKYAITFTLTASH